MAQKRRGSKRGRGHSPWREVAWAGGILLLIITVLALLAVFPRPRPPAPKSSSPPVEKPQKPLGRPLFEEPPPPERPIKKPPPIRVKLPEISIVIDDMGYNNGLDQAFIDLPYPLTFSFLPYGPHTQELARLAKAKGHEILLHLPMESSSGTPPGPGALYVYMDGQEIARILQEDLNRVPGVMGVNNHMGSRFTANPVKMRLLLLEIKRRGLIFLDSRTTAETVGYRLARELGIPSAERRVFLDHTVNKKAIRHELKRLIVLARSEGKAVAIGHPHKETLEVLKKELPRLKKKARLVPLSQVLN
ncbi:divergent polysaccharide deacetylase family protein [Thermosulfuriphilus ammonigenes]|uniref:Divergent polysaccharide deacetylase family protein n=1 Tax=Thermosulfuriphilus ammonigenes TaxID=1936021 RepID=A0A6G7PWK0_9BACT|nr:divergent polysaccharide deacetylase family protein [Thermosulfuriphilus ammonigenes]MBA2847833.1 hypothetical protein [Thermosulfuriphilus ammonigenes]QIJ71967.1 divergent polysaccharide deacetylase family protein [Thermosulfuriphilus ammonigenes]